MSIPLPPAFFPSCDNNDGLESTSQSSSSHTNDDDKETATIKVHDIYLNSDERFEIWNVKAAERPHLLQYTEETNNNDELPLIDGCDLPGWRKEKFVSYNSCSSLQSCLNIGSASTMFKRERQWPVVVVSHEQNKKNPWEELKQKLETINTSNKNGARVIDHDEYAKPLYKGVKESTTTKFALLERENVPVKILGATVGWSCMPVYKNSAADVRNTNNGVEEEDDCNGNKKWSFTCTNQQNLFHGGGVGGWTFANLLKRYGTINWRFSDTHGEMMSFSTYSKYLTNLEGTLDDSPLAIYDAEFGNDNSPMHSMIYEYTIPKCFSSDIFSSITIEKKKTEKTKNYEEARPPWRWILIGPERSGTGLHVDPLWTNAWVTVIQGKKRWMLFPPDTPREKIGMTDDEMDECDTNNTTVPVQLESSVWFRDYYDLVTSNEWPEQWRPVEVLQEPGETVFVPSGWPHLVLNLELTVAVTHNYASEWGPFFEKMWRDIVEKEPRFARLWLDQLVLQEKKDLVDRIFLYHDNAAAMGESWAKGFILQR